MKSVLAVLLSLILIGGNARGARLELGEREDFSAPVMRILAEIFFGETEEAEHTPPRKPEGNSSASVVPTARQITENVSVLVKERLTNMLSDDSVYTYVTVGSADPLQVSVSDAFSSLYLKWHDSPKPYRIVWEGGYVYAGVNGFLHEYVELPESVSEVFFVFDESEHYRLCDLFLFSEGEPPAFVQRWDAPAAQADILVFPTHSDDESIFFGPLIAHYAMEEGKRVQTAFMVDHILYPQRAHERLDALYELGVRYYPIVAPFPDFSDYDFYSALAFYRNSDIFSWQVEQIRRFQPLAVVGHDIAGEYGNAGHKVNTHYLIQAVEAAADPEHCPDSTQTYGVWDTPKFYLHLYGENQLVLDVNTPFDADGAGRTAFEIAEDALLYHRSQLHLPYRVHQGPGWERYDCRLYGLYRTLVGPDSGNDILENLEGYR